MLTQARGWERGSTPVVENTENGWFLRSQSRNQALVRSSSWPVDPVVDASLPPCCLRTLSWGLGHAAPIPE